MRRISLVLAVLSLMLVSMAVHAAPAALPHCGYYPISGFGRLWFSGERIAHLVGCPTSGEYGVWVHEQRFQHGQAIWFSDTHTVLVLTNDGWVHPFSHVGSIHQVYNSHTWVRARLGWPIEDARSLTAGYQDFQHGSMYWTHRSGRVVFYQNWWERH
jgi:uncharacterized protein with LGFP repeats